MSHLFILHIFDCLSHAYLPIPQGRGLAYFLSSVFAALSAALGAQWSTKCLLSGHGKSTWLQSLLFGSHCVLHGLYPELLVVEGLPCWASWRRHKYIVATFDHNRSWKGRLSRLCSWGSWHSARFWDLIMPIGHLLRDKKGVLSRSAWCQDLLSIPSPCQIIRTGFLLRSCLWVPSLGQNFHLRTRLLFSLKKNSSNLMNRVYCVHIPELEPTET